MKSYPLACLPERVEIYEVGPRDGLQNEPTRIDVDTKVEFISRLGDAGLRTIEVTSFVSPRLIPQLGDADELLSRLPHIDGMRYAVLVPNETGLDRLLSTGALSTGALSTGATDIAIFASASETFSQRNLNKTISESLAMFQPVVDRALAGGISVRGYISMCFGDPWEGTVQIEQAVDVALQLLEMGCNKISLGDTIGVATPGHVSRLIASLRDKGVQTAQMAVHFHDTYGQALSNTLVALSTGVVTVDSSAGGLGGCPYAKSATGNLATEDLIWMLNGLGVETGVDISSLVATSCWMAKKLGRTSPSRVVQALSADC